MIKKILIYFLLLFITLPANAYLPTEQQTPFGLVKLLSCSTAIRKTGPTYLGLFVEPLPEWQLDEPNFNLYTSDGSPITLLTPFTQMNLPQKIYPITMVPIHGTKESITFTARGFWRACKQDQCITEPIRLSRTLDSQITLMTPECGDISVALSNTPMPMYTKKVKGRAIAEDEGIKITLEFPKPPQKFIPYNDQKMPLELPFQIKGRRVTFIWPKTTQQTLHFFVKTAHRYYEIQLPVQPKGTPTIASTHSGWQILFASLLFVLFSAVPIYWSRSTKATRAQFHSQTKQMMRLTLSVCGLVLILICARGPLDLTYYPLGKLYTLIVMGLGLLFIPSSPLLVALFAFVIPKPYLSSFEDTNIITQVCFVLGSALLTWGVFALQLIFETKVFHALQGKKNVSAIWWIARLPWLALMCYILLYL